MSNLDSNYGEEINLVDLTTFKDCKAEFIINPLIVKNGVNLLTAPQKTLKSMLSNHLCVCCLERKLFLNRFEAQPIDKVLLIDQENFMGEVYMRVMKLGGNPNKFILTESKVYFDKGDKIWETLTKIINDNKIPLVIIDTLRRVNLSMDENSSKDVNRFFSKLLDLRAYTTILVLHHETKPNSYTGGTHYRGSGDIVGAVDSHISLKPYSKKEPPRQVILKHENARYSMKHPDLLVSFWEEESTFIFDSEIKSEEKSEKLSDEELKEIAMDFISATKEKGSTENDIATFLKEKHNIGRPTFQKIKRGLEEDGMIIRQDRGSKPTIYFHPDFSSSAQE